MEFSIFEVILITLHLLNHPTNQIYSKPQMIHPTDGLDIYLLQCAIVECRDEAAAGGWIFGCDWLDILLVQDSDWLVGGDLYSFVARMGKYARNEKMIIDYLN